MKSFATPSNVNKHHNDVSNDSNNGNNININFSNELRVLMTGFGDNEHPDSDSVALLEEYVIEYIQNISILAYRRSKRKGFNEIQLKDLLYYIRHDKKKYYRIPTLLELFNTLIKTNKKMDHNLFDK
jgi:hypothetical protein